MSALGQKRTLLGVQAMSALPPKADVAQQIGFVLQFVSRGRLLLAAVALPFCWWSESGCANTPSLASENQLSGNPRLFARRFQVGHVATLPMGPVNCHNTSSRAPQCR